MPEGRDPHTRETFDQEIGVGAIVRFGIGLAVLSVVVGLVSWWIFETLLSDEKSRDVPPTPIVQREGQAEIPEPRLQENPEQDLIAMRAEVDELIGTYVWLDRDRGIARIPVETSMEILLKRGLPTRPGAAAWQRPVWRDPTQSRLGTWEDKP